MTEQRENQKVTNKTGEDARRPAFVQSLAIAASFVLLLTGAWIIFSQPPSPEKLYARNFTFHPDLLSREVEDRLSETGFGANWKLLEKLNSGGVVKDSQVVSLMRWYQLVKEIKDVVSSK